MNKLNRRIAILSAILMLLTTACKKDKKLAEDNNNLSNINVEEPKEENYNYNDEENNSEENNENNENSEEENQEESEAKGDGINYTVEGEVNVRLAPSENSNILTTVNAGDDILKLGESDNWSRISINGQTGYIRSDLLKAK